jgi:hypothetical protein
MLCLRGRRGLKVFCRLGHMNVACCLVFSLEFMAPLDSSRSSQSLFAIFDTIQVFMCNRKGKFGGIDAQRLQKRN